MNAGSSLSVFFFFKLTLVKLMGGIVCVWVCTA